MPREKLYRLDINRTLTMEEMTALWQAFSHNKVMSEQMYENLPQSLKTMAVPESTR